jgi:hypothetical protein
LAAASVNSFEILDAQGRSSSGVTIIGSSAINTIYGSAYADSIDGAGGADFIDAGSGSDSVVYYTGITKFYGGDDASADYLVFNTAPAGGFLLTSAVTGFEVLDARSISSGITITGGNDADSIFGGTGNDSINAATGNDYVWAGTGADTVVAGTGADSIWLGAASFLGMTGADTDSHGDLVIFHLGDQGTNDSIDYVFNFALSSDSVWTSSSDDLFGLTNSSNRVADSASGFISKGGLIVTPANGDTVFANLETAISYIEGVSSGASGDSVLGGGELILFKASTGPSGATETYIGFAGSTSDINYVIKLVGVNVPLGSGLIETSTDSDVYFIGPPGT